MITRRKIVTSLIYKFFERVAGQGITFVVGVVLARLLTPENYGSIAILTIFIGLANVFVQAGMGTALVQKKDVNETDYSSVFYAQLTISIVAYIILFFAAPYIALFYNIPDLSILLRSLALVLIPNCYNSIQNAKIQKEMEFKKLLYRSIIAAVISGTVGIAMAYSDFGVWALVAQQLSNSVASCIIMTFAVKWYPKPLFSFERLKSLFVFGYKMLLSGLLDTLYRDLKGLIIGKKYTADNLGFYNRGQQYPQVAVDALNGTIMSVMFPAFAKEQHDKERVKTLVHRSIIMSSFIVFPAMAGLAATARPLVALMLTEKWLPAVPYLMISCGIFAFYPIHTANLQAIAAMGESETFFKLEIIKKAYGLAVLLITVFFFNTPIAIMLGSLCTVPIGCIVNAFPNKRLLGYTIKEQAIDILPVLLLSVVMGIAVYCVSFMGLGNVLTLIIQIPLGVAVYAVLSKICRVEAFGYLWGVVGKVIRKK